MPAEIGSRADSPQADSTSRVNNNEDRGSMTSGYLGLMLSAEHLPATVGAFLAGHDTVVHIADFIAFGRAGFADLRAKLVKAMLKMRAGKLKISRSLADFGAAHH